MLGLGLEHTNSLPATPNIWVVRPGHTWANARTCLAAIVTSTIPKKLAAILRSRFEKLIMIVCCFVVKIAFIIAQKEVM